ncbi:hypothetical protein GF324_02745 [bacterium]|nr:hypothetical protein [bacterium]
MALAKAFRNGHGLGNQFKDTFFQIPALAAKNDILPVYLEEKNVWRVMDRVGQYHQRFAQRYKHDRSKAALGLPRTVDSFRGPKLSTTIDGRRVERFAGPVHKHVHAVDGEYLVRYLAFRTPYLSARNSDWAVLDDYLAQLEE